MSLVASVTAVLALGGVASAATPSVAAEPSPAQSADDLASRFTLAVLPDTQFYSRYSAGQFESRYGTDPFEAQTSWLAQHADELEIPFVAHLGDVVDQARQEAEWTAADRAMTHLEDAHLPYSILAGNHDVLNEDTTLADTDYDIASEPYTKWFGANRAATQETYQGSDPTGFSQYHIFEAEGQEFMVLALPWRASDATFSWAESAMAAHPDVPVILTTHQLIDIAPDGVTAEETDYGLEVWDKLIRSHDQIFMTLNGHFHGAARQTKLNDAGNPVTQIVIDYQMAYEGGNGYLGLFEFDLTNNRISVLTGSPWVVAKPQELLTSFDQAFLEGENQQFTLDIDFANRFQNFAPDFTAGPATSPSLTEKARAILLDGFTAPAPPTTSLPASTDDYPRVDGTLAHWRTNGLEGLVAPGSTVPDVAGDADLTRAAIEESGSPTAQPGDVAVVDDSDPLSSDGTSLCFANSSKVANRFSYLTTPKGAAVNDAALDNGYTIETFLKIDAGWTEPENAWMKAIVRSGNRSKIGVPQTRWDWTASPVALGLSNLREFQWTEVPTDTGKGDRTNWSGEIIVDKWHHVAMVNDAKTAFTTMYVDGAPVLRTASDTIGHGLDAGMPWLFGSDWVDNKATNGWDGCIGETRVIDHATTPSEWLTARATAQELEPIVNTALPAISGTPAVGGTLSATGGTWNAQAPSLAYQWNRDQVSIEGATSPSYQLVGADAGRSITVTVAATADGFAGAQATSNPMTVRKASARVTGSPDRWLMFGSRPIVYSGSVSAEGLTPTGTVTLFSGSQAVGTATLEPSADGRFSITVPKVGRGLHLLTARYSGDASIAPASSWLSIVITL